VNMGSSTATRSSHHEAVAGAAFDEAIARSFAPGLCDRAPVPEWPAGELRP
jgi:hypothetical protein